MIIISTTADISNDTFLIQNNAYCLGVLMIWLILNFTIISMFHLIQNFKMH